MFHLLSSTSPQLLTSHLLISPRFFFPYRLVYVTSNISLTSRCFLSVVLTTVWCELMADPKLFNFRHRVVTRDHKFIAIFALFLGGFVGRAIIDAAGAAATLGVGTGMRVVIAFWWLFVPGKQGSKTGKPAAA